MGPFINQGDQLEQGGKVEEWKIYGGNFLVEKLDQTKPNVKLPHN